MDVRVDSVKIASEDTDSDSVVHHDLLVHFIFGPFTLLQRRESDDSVVSVNYFRRVPLPLGFADHGSFGSVIEEVLLQDGFIAIFI